MLVLLELFYILTVSMLVSSLWHCTIGLQGNVTGENFIVFYNCMWIGKVPWRREGQPTPVFLPWESHGQRSLVGFGAWGCKVLDTTGVTWHAHTHPYIYILYFSRQSNLLFSMVTLGMSPLWECPTSRCLSPLPQNPTSLSRQDQSSSGHLCWLLSDHLGAHLLLQVSSTKHFA